MDPARPAGLDFFTRESAAHTIPAAGAADQQGSSPVNQRTHRTMPKPSGSPAGEDALAGGPAQQASEQRVLDLLDELYELEQFRREQLAFRRLAGYLKSSLTTKEAFAAVECLGPELWPGMAGALYSLRGDDEGLDRVAAWGGVLSETRFDASECWALRRGELHLVAEASSSLQCAHVKSGAKTLSSLCIPLIAQSRLLGLFHLQRLKSAPASLRSGTSSARGLDVAVMAAQEVSFALANLCLQQALREQAIRDPLTGLFNRKVFEELLGREVARAERKTHQLSVIVLDLDHFKHINDTFGHSAGDAVLRHVGPVLQAHVRESDLACRIGGEEFLLLLAELALPVAVQRADAIRVALRQNPVKFGDKIIDPVTASFGAAAYPYHGRTVEALFRAADKALLDAKRTGRDRVVAAPLPT